MKRLGLFIGLMLMAQSAFAIAYPNRTIRDTDGDQLAINADGSINLNVASDINVSSFALVNISTISANATGLRITDDSKTLGIFIADGGKVGIGTDSPEEKLHILDGDVLFDFPAGDPDFYIRNKSTDVIKMQGLNGFGGNIQLADDTNTTRIRLRGYDGDTYFNGGNVGIGTASPLTKTEIQAAGAAAEPYLTLSAYSAVSGYNPRLYLSKSHNNTAGTKTSTINGESLGEIIFQGVDLAGNTDSGAWIKAVQNGTAAGRAPTDLYLYTYGDTDANTNQIVLHHDGNVGIGTASPLETLQVNGETVLKTDELFSLTSGLITTAGNVSDSLQVVASSTTSGIGGIGASIAFASPGTSPRRGAVIASVQGTTDVDQMGLAFYTHPTTLVGDPIVLQFRIAYDGGLHVANLKTAVDQATAGAVAGEIWADSDDGYALKLGQ